MFALKYTRVLVVFVVAAFIGEAHAIDCYVCRSCAEVGPDDVQTCPVTGTTTEEPVFSTIEPTTDQDMHFDLPEETENVQIVEYPFLEEEEARDSDLASFVIDDSKLPGSEFLSRSLKQFRTAEDDARCVIAVFEENGQLDVVRGCSTASENHEARCLEAIGDGFTGSLQYCNLCEDDLCNSAAKSAIALVLVVAGVFINL